MKQILINMAIFSTCFALSYTILNGAAPSVVNKGSVAPAEAKTSPSRAVVRNIRPSNTETAVPQPRRSTATKPNAGRPTEVNRVTVTKQSAGATPTVKVPNSGVPKYPEPKAQTL